MTNEQQFTQNINKILPRITSTNFWDGKGISNEIPFYIFDYPPEFELQVRDYIDTLTTKELKQQLPDRNVIVVNLLELLLNYIEHRGYLEKILNIAESPDNSKTLKSIKSITNAEKLAEYYANEIMVKQPDLVLIHGVGSVYPIIQAHELLNNLQQYTKTTPVILFYPGEYDKTTFRLFGKTNITLDSATDTGSRSSKYYRAFPLID
jgi:hypothetical protein